MMVLHRGIVMALLMGTGVYAGYKSMDEIPGSCTPSPLVPDNGRCLFSSQCASGFCCPFFKSCLGNDGYDPLSPDAVQADPLRLKMMWGKDYGGEATCAGAAEGQSCDVCAMRECSAQMACDQCILMKVDGKMQPMFEGNEYNMPPYDIADPGCGCHADFVAAFKAGTWVEGCAAASGGGESPAPEPEPEPATSGGDAAAANETRAAVSTVDKSIHDGLAFGTFVLVATALTLN